MASVKEHYDTLLSEVYTWMFGGFAEAKKRNAEFFKSRHIAPVKSGRALDLGAGSGFQSVPLAEAGFAVTAIDLSENLLKELSGNGRGLNIHTVQDDLINFQNHCGDGLELIVCMTDTILHLESRDKVAELLKKSFGSLEKDGKLVLTFRDLTDELKGLDRFIPVKSDENTIFTCFLEYEPETVKVHDVVYRRSGGEWELMKSFFRKLKLSASWVEEQLSSIGFAVDESSVENGFTAIVARK